MKVLRKEIPWTDPYDLFVLLKRDEPSFLLESLRGGRKTSRYSFIGITPKIIIRNKGKEIKVLHSNNTESVSCGNPFETVRGLLKKREVLHPGDIPPFAGGAVGYFGYDMVHLFEKLPHRAQDDLQLPDMVLMIVDVIIAFDHMRKKGWIIVIQDGSDERGDGCREQMEEIERRMRKRAVPIDPGRSGVRIKMVSNLTQKEYIDMVRRCKEYIAAGDIFQANLSQRLSVQIKGVDPLRIYGILRKVNPSPFSAFIDTGEMQLVSSSPERLIRLYDGLVETRPIAGTRPRGRDPKENGMLQKELLASEKERAEHIMLVDLERNDIGRVCRYGSIRVDEFMELESYSHVNHIVSNVVGEIEPGR
ncbi:MAG TPA: anthranilate synthase component I family protein, partial [Thermodesulfovibrionales bacterium]|nr:anthranilate synthase component I family protein [Thermodesulfovibrionales bacterium]